MAKLYGYRLQHRDTDGIALLRGDRLPHQYIVDAYAAIEQNCLKIIKMPWQSADGPAAQMRLLHSRAIPNGLTSRERCHLDSNLRIDPIW
ncbi:unnamed protein product [Sphagnum troendelagicum]|uniref:Uncharacterized protein n=1 Tax=Sphagnum troendelagicum TaxID=128251 RepID=A0ABP0UK58_9BRYO